MTSPPQRTTLLSLPVELRLIIAAYALEQPRRIGLDDAETIKFRNGRRRLRLISEYKPSTNLAILLVCRQFNNDFTRLAFQKTRFVLRSDASGIICDQTDAFLRDVRRLVVCCTSDTIAAWDAFPFNTECLQLDQLDFVTMITSKVDLKPFVRMFRQLQNVKEISFTFDPKTEHPAHGWVRLLVAMLKEDEYQRYHAPNAPNIEATWWNWTFHSKINWGVFVAQPPKPIMPES